MENSSRRLSPRQQRSLVGALAVEDTRKVGERNEESPSVILRCTDGAMTSLP